jgi:hAT family C-terminal dimerisation region
LLLVTDLFDDQPSSSLSENIFDDLPALSAPPESDLHDELDRYLSMDPEHVTNALAWWHRKRFVYPRLHRMALNYLTIPGEFYLLFDSLIFILTSDSFTSNIRGC